MSTQESETAGGHPPRRKALRLRPFMVVAGLFALAAALAGLPAVILALMLSRGPVDAGFMTGQIAAMIERRLGEGFKVSVRELRLSRDGDGLVVEGEGVGVRDETGRLVIEAPRALVALDGRALLGLAVEPREIEFVGLRVALVIMPDGSVSISAGEGEDTAPPTRHARATDAAPLHAAAFVDAFAAPTGALAVLERAGLREGTLIIDDRRNGRRATYSDLSLLYSRPAEETRLAVRARGMHGRWGASLVVRGAPGAVRSIEATVQDLAVAEILGFAEAGTSGIRTDMPVSFELRAQLDGKDVLTALDGVITGGSAQVVLPGRDLAPIAVDRMNGRFALAPDGRIEVPELDVSAGGVAIKASGAVDLPRGADDSWRVTLVSREASVSRIDPKAPPIRLDRLALSARFLPGFSGVVVDSATAEGAETDLRLSAALGSGGEAEGLRFKVQTGRMPVDAVLAFWPAFSAPVTRRWMIDHVDGGFVDYMTLGLALSPADVAKAVGPDPLPEGSFGLRAALSEIMVRPANGLPRLEKLVAEGRLTERTASFEIDRATTAAGLALSEGHFRIDDTSAVPPQAAISFRLRGGADNTAAVLRGDALRDFTGPQIPEADKIKGTVDAAVTVDMPLRKGIAPAEVRVAARGTIKALAWDGAVGKERLESPELSFAFDGGRLTAKGEGRIGGIPANFDYARPAGGAEPTYAVQLTIDDSVRTKRGLKTAGQISGPVSMRVTAREGSARNGLAVEIDLTKAAVTGLLPTWAKPAGRASKATLRVRPLTEDRFELIDFALDGGGGFLVKGDGEITSDGTLNTARLSQVRLSTGDDMKVELERMQNGTRLSVRAQSLDARPFLKSVFGPTGSGGGGLSYGDLDVDLKAASMQGFASEAMTAADLKLTTRGGDVRDFRLAGRLGRAPVAGQMARSETGAPAIVIESADAGAFLRYVDLYRRMTGGALLLQISPQADPLTGLIVVQNFTLRNDPALAGVARSSANPAGRSLVDDAANVGFSKLRVEFSRGRDGVLTLSDGVMLGAVIGGTLEGKVDFARDKVDLTGTFVPAYGLNNIPNKVPLFGALLFGGPNEGLFAVNFRITGSPANPVVAYNPLSAVAPGFLRKFFGVGGPAEAPVPPAPVPETRPAQPAR